MLSENHLIDLIKSFSNILRKKNILEKKYFYHQHKWKNQCCLSQTIC